MIHLPIITDKLPVPAEVTDAIDAGVVFKVLNSGGKDSIAMTLYLMELGANIELHYHKVGTLFDWSCTQSYVEAFAKAFDLPLYISYRDGGLIREVYRTNEGLQDVMYQQSPGGDFSRLKSRKGASTKRMWPAVAADLGTRWCSSTQKIDVMYRVLANDARFKTGVHIMCTGERKQESVKRSSYEELVPHKSTCKSRTVHQWRPILGWTEEEVWSIIERYKIQPHPAYMLGWSRCSCQLCIFGSDNTWATLMELDPGKVLTIDSHEKDLNHTIYADTSYTKVNGKRTKVVNPISILDKAKRGTSWLIKANLYRWGFEALNTFTSPIIVDEWVTPQGAYSVEAAGSV